MIKNGDLVQIVKGDYKDNIGVVTKKSHGIISVRTAILNKRGINSLKTIYIKESFAKKYRFKVGDIVKHKNLFKNRLGVIYCLSKDNEDLIGVDFGRSGKYNLVKCFLTPATKVKAEALLV